MEIKELMKESHKIAVEKGFWAREKGITENTNLLSLDREDLYKIEKRNDSELLMLIVSELGETCEALRHGNPPSEHIPEFSSVEEELADCMIRIADMAEARGYRLEEALKAKLKFNKTREKLHGKKF